MTPKTTVARLKAADFDTIERMTITRLQLLRASIESMGPNPLNDKIANNLFLPAYGLIAQFCRSITITESDGSPALGFDLAEICPLLAHINGYMDDGQRFRALNTLPENWTQAVDLAVMSLDGSEESLNALRAAIDATQ
jgi:hypothetical protein